MRNHARPKLAAMSLVFSVITSIALLLVGCSDKPADVAQVPPGLPEVTHLEDVGGRIRLSELDGKILILAERGVVLEVGTDDLQPVDDVEAPVWTTPNGFLTLPSMPIERRDGLTILRTEGGFGSPVKITFADGNELLLEPQVPIRDIRDAGLVDINGDGKDELLLIARGDPGICKDTYTGYVGWAELGDDGRYQDVQWQEPLGGGLVGLAIADIDGQPGEELILGVYETYCSGIPSDLWVFSP